MTGAQWDRLEPLLPVSNGRCGRWRDHRQVVNGLPYRIRTGVHWRDLPERYGPWKTVHERHRRWSAAGTWEMRLRRIQAEAYAAGEIDWDVSVAPTSARTPPGRRRPARSAVRVLCVEGVVSGICGGGPVVPPGWEALPGLHPLLVWWVDCRVVSGC